ncbi:hypothetical protein K439DRAFT_1230742, partial [Ramaria rubella]
IPIFFFLTVLFCFRDYPGPYRNVEKGLLLIYHLISDLQSYIDKADCVGLDGGYALYLKQILAKNKKLHEKNFSYPIRKQPKQKLSANEERYNEKFGSFHSIIEAWFGELGILFSKFNNKRPIRTTDPMVFTFQFQVACLLLNVLKTV